MRRDSSSHVGFYDKAKFSLQINQIFNLSGLLRQMIELFSRPLVTLKTTQKYIDKEDL